MPKTHRPSLWHKCSGTLRYLFHALSGAYALSVLLFLLGRGVIGESWLLIAFFNTFAHLLWLPAFLLLPVALLLRLRSLSLLLLPPIIAFLWVYGGQLVPQSVPVPQDAQTLRVLSFNVLADNTRFDAVVAVIRESGADVVALQELSLPLADFLAAHLDEEYPHQALHPNAQATAGQAVLSRYPVLQDEYWRYDWLPVALAHQRVLIDSPGAQFAFYNIHLAHPGMGPQFFEPCYRSRELAAILQRATQEQVPIILAGDFNMPDLSDDYATITAHYRDAFREVGRGLGWTFPQTGTGLPRFLRLDYVFYSADLQAAAAHVGPKAAGSDHHPLHATLLFNQS